MTAVTSSFDDGEDVPTPGDGFAAENAETLAAIRAIGDPATRLAVFILLVLTVFRGRVGR